MNLPGPIQHWKIERLVPYEQNARLHSMEQVNRIAESIREFGWTVPILADAQGCVIAGHGRLQAALRLGLEEVPVIVADGLTETQIRAYRIADNQLTLAGAWNEEALHAEMAALAATDIDLNTLGFDPGELDKWLEPLTQPDEEPVPEDEEVPEPPAEPASGDGDLWTLGEHRLLCGDCTDAEAVRRVMNGERAVLMNTDPPYGVEYIGWFGNRPPKGKTGKKWDGRKAIDVGEAGIDELYNGFIGTALAEALGDNTAFYLWHSDMRRKRIEGIWVEHGIHPHQVVIWDKMYAVLSRTDYMGQHEPCLYGWKQGRRPKVYKGDRDGGTVWKVPSGPKPKFHQVNEGYCTVWSVKKPAGADRPDHPTPKPPRLFEIPIRRHVKRGGVCYEPFSGSGSQIIAAENNGRRCFAIEINPIYIDVAILRWEAHTGRKAVREDGSTMADLTKA